MGARPLPIGLVGTGFGQRILAPAIQRCPSFKLVGVSAGHVSSARRTARQFAIPRVYPHWRAMVNDPSIQALIIATPPHAQREITRAALRQGKHVFVEKPIAASGSHAKVLLDAARNAEVAHMVDFEFTTLPAWEKARELLRAKALGRLRHAEVSWHVETYASLKNERSWKRDARRGGGVLNSFLSHSLNYVEWLLGPATAISASLFPSPHKEETAFLQLRMANGTVVSLSVSTCAKFGTGHRVSVYGDRGTLVIDNPGRDYARGFQLRVGRVSDSALKTIPVRQMTPANVDGRIPAIVVLLERFAKWIHTGQAQHPNFAEGARVDRLMDAAHLSARKKGSWLTVPAR